MKVSNTDIIDTVGDDKKRLIKGWCFKKSLSTVPKSENYGHESMHAQQITTDDFYHF